MYVQRETATFMLLLVCCDFVMLHRYHLLHANCKMCESCVNKCICAESLMKVTKLLNVLTLTAFQCHNVVLRD